MKPILVLASFGTGSTYFQRAATFWIRELLEPSFVNPHELLNGIADKNGSLVKKWTTVTEQSLTELTELIRNTQSPFLARIAYDHLILRNENTEELGKFCRFLTEYFDIYVCLRDNLFDYGLCYALRRCTDREPMYQINCTHTPEDREQLYEGKKFVVDAAMIIPTIERYLKYKTWVHNIFPTATPILYDDIDNNIDLVLMQHFPSDMSIKDIYGISIAEYTQLNYARSKQLQFSHEGSDRIHRRMQEYLDQHIMIDTIPVKSTTMIDKHNIIANYNECADAYMTWEHK